jgi:thiosulfate dehydrogenase [quinone] large subunit
MQMDRTSFFFLRLPIALSMLGHGLVRLPKLQEFSEGMVGSMEKSILPSALVLAWAYLLPILEALLGILLVVGYKAKYTIYASLVVMSILIIGSSSIEAWGAVQAQLIHALYFFALLWYVEKHHPLTAKI